MGILSSVGHAGSPKNRYRVHLDDINWNTRNYNAVAAYCEAKVAANLYAMELAERLKGTGVSTASIHPGWARSNFGGSGFMMQVLRVLLYPFRKFSKRIATRNQLKHLYTACFLMMPQIIQVPILVSTVYCTEIRNVKKEDGQ